jgi:hypothetical protein
MGKVAADAMDSLDTQAGIGATVVPIADRDRTTLFVDTRPGALSGCVSEYSAESALRGEIVGFSPREHPAGGVVALNALHLKRLSLLSAPLHR